jgi:hypothetical protein
VNRARGEWEYSQKIAVWQEDNAVVRYGSRKWKRAVTAPRRWSECRGEIEAAPVRAASRIVCNGRIEKRNALPGYIAGYMLQPPSPLLQQQRRPIRVPVVITAVLRYASAGERYSRTSNRRSPNALLRRMSPETTNERATVTRLRSEERRRNRLSHRRPPASGRSVRRRAERQKEASHAVLQQAVGCRCCGTSAVRRAAGSEAGLRKRTHAARRWQRRTAGSRETGKCAAAHSAGQSAPCGGREESAETSSQCVPHHSAMPLFQHSPDRRLRCHTGARFAPPAKCEAPARHVRHAQGMPPRRRLACGRSPQFALQIRGERCRRARCSVCSSPRTPRPPTPVRQRSAGWQRQRVVRAKAPRRYWQPAAPNLRPAPTLQRTTRVDAATSASTD